MTTTATERVYAAIPRVYRAQEADLGYPLRTWLSLLTDQLAEVDEIVERDEGNVDPALTPPSWLPWLGQLVGVRQSASLPIVTQRARIADPLKHRHGSAHMISRCITDAWPDANPVVVPHWRDAPWLIAASTTPDETPLTGTAITTWDEFEATFPTWADAEAAIDTWDDLSSIDRIHVDVAAAARAEEPAGSRVFHLWKSDVAALVGSISAVGASGPAVAGGTVEPS